MKEFPILISYDGTAGPCPRSIPWDVIAPYGRQAELNHSQTLERLAERGGLSPVEAWLVMNGKRWQGETFTKEREIEACAFLDKIVKNRSELVAERDALKLQIRAIREALRATCSEASMVLDDPTTNEQNRHQYGGRLRLAQELAQAIDAGDFAEKLTCEVCKRSDVPIGGCALSGGHHDGFECQSCCGSKTWIA